MDVDGSGCGADVGIGRRGCRRAGTGRRMAAHVGAAGAVEAEGGGQGLS